MNDDKGFVPLFNGVDLEGWSVIPRSYGTLYPGGPKVLDVLTAFPADYNEAAAEHPAAWSVEEGVIVGRQDSPGSGWGGYLITDHEFGDFELRFEARPDWPADTGVMLRRRFDSWEGIQVLIDHRQSGSIGGYYGNGIGGFHAVPFALTRADGESGGLVVDDPATSVEPFAQSKADMLEYAATVEEFLAVWRWNDWNEFTVRCEGGLPRVTTWINGVKISQVDLATLVADDYNAADVAATLGTKGRIALEVHDNDPMLGDRRWGPGAACRWRNLMICEIDT
jgi:hypothetical protein